MFKCRLGYAVKIILVYFHSSRSLQVVEVLVVVLAVTENVVGWRLGKRKSTLLRLITCSISLWLPLRGSILEGEACHQSIGIERETTATLTTRRNFFKQSKYYVVCYLWIPKGYKTSLD